MTVKELIDELQKYPPETTVFRLMTHEHGTRKIENVTWYEKQKVIVIN